MFQKLYARLALTLFLSFVLLACFCAYVFVQASAAYQQQVTQLMHKDLAAHVVDEHLLFENGEPNLEAAKTSFHQLMILGPNFEFYLLDKSGNILAYSTKPSNIKRVAVNINVFDPFLTSQHLQQPLYGEDPRGEHRQKIFSVAPIYTGKDISGYLYVILGSEIYDGIAAMVSESNIVQWSLWILLIGVGFSLLATLWLTGAITQPLRKLLDQVSAVRKTGFSPAGIGNTAIMADLHRWNPNSANEIHALGSDFCTLLETLDEQYKNVLTVDQLRKELLSHISHDLRTPLSSLLGYLETWEINRENLSEADSMKYIATAKRSAQKISKLVEQLFELAYLDSGNVQVNREQFSIAELVQDVIQKFAIMAQEKQLAISVDPKDSSLRVVGDIEKLERVFTNLIDNAIRHTHEGGEILVRLLENSRSVAVEISDTGIGIPLEDVAHVFEPHYKAGNSVRGNTAHGGLGLAITKKLLELHHSPISVQSCEREGTTFLFQLQSANA